MEVLRLLRCDNDLAGLGALELGTARRVIERPVRDRVGQLLRAHLVATPTDGTRIPTLALLTRST